MKNSILILLVSVALYSCGNEREESMEKTEECLEDKYDDELSKLETIEEALTAYDFVSARTLLACYEDACYKNDDLQNDCPKFRDGYNQISKETKKEWADRKSQQNQHFKMEYKIVYTEVTYFLNNGEHAKAIASANESDLFFVYKNQLPTTVNKWANESKLDLALKVLSTYTFTEVFVKETTKNLSVKSSSA